MAKRTFSQNVRPALFPEDRLAVSISEFLDWLRTKVNVVAIGKYEVRFPRASRSDWLMHVVQSGTTTIIKFNTFILRRISFEFFEQVILHECFHLFVQNLPNKENAKELRDDFGDDFMKLLDIEADFFTALFYKERRKATLVDIFKLYHEGSRVFGDPAIRRPKLERFIGSVLSIAHVFLSDPDRLATLECDLYLPTIGNIPTQDSLHILIARRSHFVLSRIHADYHDFIEMKRCYTNEGPYTSREYVEHLVRFACKALGYKEIPLRILRQLDAFQ